jgi:signal transduction histidine kinase
MGERTNSAVQLEAVLQTIPLFSELDQVTLACLVQTGSQVEYPANHILYHEGDTPDYLYVILAGKVRVFGTDDAGNEVTLRVMAAGAFFGELALLDRKPRSASIVCITPCQFFTLGQTALMDLLQRAPSETLSRFFSILTAQVRNTTERYILEEQAKRTIQAEAEIARHRALSQMVAGVAHELNTPLGIANTAADIVDNRLNSIEFASLRAANPTIEVLFEDVLEATDLIKRNLARAHKLVENFKRISIGQVTDLLEKVDLANLVADIVELYSISARAANLEIQLVNQLTPANREWTGYAGYLTQVLLNLLTNVARYAYPSGDGGVVEITLAEDSSFRTGGFAITVRDYGVGIAPEPLAQIFDPFFTTGRHKGGTGLGMTIVQSLISEAMQGTIQIASTPGEGTTVLLLLPKVVTAH